MVKDDLTLRSIGQLNGKVPLQPQFLTVNILSQTKKSDVVNCGIDAIDADAYPTLYLQRKVLYVAAMQTARIVIGLLGIILFSSFIAHLYVSRFQIHTLCILFN